MTQLFAYRDRDENRMGSCDWLPEPGDVCARLEKNGDGFHNYAALRKTDKGVWVLAGRFGAYSFGKQVGEIDEPTLYTALSGLPITLKTESAADKERQIHYQYKCRMCSKVFSPVGQECNLVEAKVNLLDVEYGRGQLTKTAIHTCFTQINERITQTGIADLIGFTSSPLP